MASKPVAGLFRRGSVWYARFFVPIDAQVRLGKEDVAWSLKTDDLREARRRLPAMQARFEALTRHQSVMAAGQAAQVDPMAFGIDLDNPALGVPIKGANSSDRQPFSRADLDVLMIMLIGLHAGAKRNEICQQKGTDILQEDGI